METVPASDRLLESVVARVSPIVIVVLLASIDHPFDTTPIVDMNSFVASSLVKLLFAENSHVRYISSRAIRSAGVLPAISPSPVLSETLDASESEPPIEISVKSISPLSCVENTASAPLPKHTFFNFSG